MYAAIPNVAIVNVGATAAIIGFFNSCLMDWKSTTTRSVKNAISNMAIHTKICPTKSNWRCNMKFPSDTIAKMRPAIGIGIFLMNDIESSLS